nr:MAG TPA: hypothetical protein [Caudoviricetes sp.]DAR61092.1 MAG TPA: hypothetical protein [Caudoviricetes sp.]
MVFSMFRLPLIKLRVPRGSKTAISRSGLFPVRVLYSPPSRHR